MKRQNPFNKKINDSELENLIEKQIEGRMGKDTIANLSDSHPLKKILNREDNIATVELYSLSKSIERMAKIDEKWLETRLKDIKSEHLNNINGALFEIYGISLLNFKENIAKPTKKNQSGVDAILSLNTGKSINFSLKRFSISEHQKAFIKFSKEFENSLVQQIQFKNIRDIKLTIQCNIYPQKDDWKCLNSFLDIIFQSFKNHKKGKLTVENWEIDFEPLFNNSENDIYNNKSSYTIYIFSPFHNNEKKNIFDKIENAAVNIKKHAIEDDNTLNFVLIRIPDNINYDSCLKLANDYIEEKSEKEAITGIMFYQPYMFETDKTYTLRLAVGFVCNLTKYERLGLGKNPFGIDIPCGQITQEPALIKYKKILTAKNIISTDCYIFKSGHHYKTTPNIIENNLLLEFSMEDFGVFNHRIWENNSDNDIQFDPTLFPPTDILELI